MAYTHADVIDWATGVAAVPEVAAATAQRHDRAHSLTSAADHVDILATTPIASGSVLQYNAAISKWVPVVLASADASTYAQTMMLMGG